MTANIKERQGGLLFILVGPGGVGKNTLMKGVLARMDGIRQLPTATTRAPRPGETNGVERLFVDRDQFQQMIANHDLIEHEEVHTGVFYGMPRQPVETAIADGTHLIADVDVAGARNARIAYPDNTVVIFIAPPSVDVLAERMRSRGETEDGIRKRMQRVAEEMAFQPESDHIIINADEAAATDALYALIERIRSEGDPSES